MSPFAKYVLSVLLGIGIGVLTASTFLNKRIAQQNATIEDLKQDASNLDDKIELLETERDFFKTASGVFREKMQRTQGQPAIPVRIQSPAELADRGPIGTGSLLDPTCRRFCGGPPIPAQFVISTVIVDGSGAPRFILPGHLLVGIDGDVDGTRCYHFNNGFWSATCQLQRIPH